MIHFDEFLLKHVRDDPIAQALVAESLINGDVNNRVFRPCIFIKISEEAVSGQYSLLAIERLKIFPLPEYLIRFTHVRHVSKHHTLLYTNFDAH